MAASIAKLAIQLTTDTRELKEGLQRVQDLLKATKATAESSQLSEGWGIEKALGKFFTLEKVFGALKAELRFISKAALDFQDHLNNITGGDKLDTFRGQWERLSTTIGAALLPATNAVTKALKGWLDSVDDSRAARGLTRWGDYLKGVETAATNAKKAAAAVAEEQKRAAQAAADHARIQEQLIDEGFRLKESLRTPGESIAVEISKLRDLLGAAAIDQETVRRAAAKIAKEYAGATEQARKFKDITKPNAGAFERGSASEFSARNSANFEIKRQAEYSRQQLEIERQQLAEQKRMVQQQQAIVDAVLKPKFQKGKF